MDRRVRGGDDRPFDMRGGNPVHAPTCVQHLMWGLLVLMFLFAGLGLYTALCAVVDLLWR